MTDLNLSEDLLEIHREAQKRVDRVIAARVELAAAMDDLVAGRESILKASEKAVAFVDAYLNPVMVNPEPIAPEVAMELPPEAEIPVFTTVDAEGLTYFNVSGGEVAVEEEILEEVFGEYVEFIEEEEVE
jgi:hypothetical protein